MRHISGRNVYNKDKTNEKIGPKETRLVMTPCWDKLFFFFSQILGIELAWSHDP